MNHQIQPNAADYSVSGWDVARGALVTTVWLLVPNDDSAGNVASI